MSGPENEKPDKQLPGPSFGDDEFAASSGNVVPPPAQAGNVGQSDKETLVAEGACFVSGCGSPAGTQAAEAAPFLRIIDIHPRGVRILTRVYGSSKEGVVRLLMSETPEPDPRVWRVLQALDNRRLLWPQILVFGSGRDRLTVFVDLYGPALADLERRVNAISWAFPWPIRFIPMDAEWLDIVKRAKLGVVALTQQEGETP